MEFELAASGGMTENVPNEGGAESCPEQKAVTVSWHFESKLAHYRTPETAESVDRTRDPFVSPSYSVNSCGSWSRGI
jgi:hypothetical protein